MPTIIACEAGLRAEQRASGAKMAVANRTLHGGVERSDKIKRPGSGVDRVFEAVHNWGQSIRQFALLFAW
jgi:hypothetical protein